MPADTTVSAGVLQLGNNAALGSTNGNLAVNGGLLDLHGFNVGTAAFSGSATVDNLATSSTSTLTVGNGNATATYSGTILSSSGVVSLVKSGTGALTLTGNNFYTGTTTVNGGLLVVTGSHNGGGTYAINGGTLGGLATISAPVSLNAGTTLFPGIAGGGTMSLGGLSLAGTNNNVLFDLTNNPLSGDDEVALSGALSLAGTTAISVNKLNTALGSGNYPLFTYTSLSGNPATQLSLASSATVLTSRQNYSFIASNGVVSLSVSGAAQTLTWNGSGGTSTWDNGTANYAWTNNVNNPDIFVLGDNVIFSNSGSRTIVNVHDAVVPNTVLVTGSNNYTLSGTGSIGGQYTPLTMQGTGVLTLGTTGNSYAGGTLLQSGTLALGAANALPATGVLTMGSTGTSSTLDLAGCNQQIQTLVVGSGATAASQTIGNSSTSNTATLTVSGGTSTFGGVIQDTLGGGSQKVALTVTGSGNLALTGPNTYTGATTVNNGSLLQIGNGASGELFASQSVIDNGTLTFNHADSLTYPGAIGGSGTVVKLGNGLLTLTCTGCTFTGQTTVSAGTLQVGDGLTTNGLIMGAILNNASLVFANPGNITCGSAIGGSGSLAEIGDGTLTLTNTNSYSGGTLVQSGTLALGLANALPKAGIVTLGAAGSAGAIDIAGFNAQIAGLAVGSGMCPPRRSWATAARRAVPR